MSGNVSDYRFVLYERLASQKLNAILSQLNSHDHGDGGGLEINANAAIAPGSIGSSLLAAGSVNGTILALNSVTTNHIENGTITYEDLNTTSIHLSADGYAVYAP